MKEFFKRQGIEMTVGDLHRFAGIITDDLDRVLKGYDLLVRLFDVPEREAELAEDVRRAVREGRVAVEEDTGKLHIPVIDQDRPLALISASPRKKVEPSEELVRLLPALIRLSLEKLLLYKINVTDRDTGLNNEYYFRNFVSRQIADTMRRLQGPGDQGRPRPLRLGQTEDTPALTVLLAQVDDFERIEVSYGRDRALAVLAAVVDRLREAAGPKCLARLGGGRIGALIRGDSGAEAARALTEWSKTPLGDDLPRFRLICGLASYPQDFYDDFSPGRESRAEPADTPGTLMDRAELALHHAGSHPGRPWFLFSDVLRRGGRVVQLLPYHRVVVNLGRTVGAREGQVFVLSGPDGERSPDIKGEVVLFDVQQDFAIGEIIALKSSVSRVQTGDWLSLSQPSADEAASGEEVRQERLDPLLGIPDHQGFMSLLTARLEQHPTFAVILIRVDGYDEYRTTMGHLESDRQFQALYDLIANLSPPDGLIGRFSAESLIVFLPDHDADAAKALAESWRDQVVRRLRQTSTFGAAVHPTGAFTAPEATANAQKALEHASFFGPASVALFNAVSLNISGDKRFESGDYQGAFEEYQLALDLDPDEVNVLNSLGVCHGYLGQVDQALDVFQRVLSIDPDNLMALFNRGFALAMAGRNEEALAAYRRAAELDPDNFDVRFQLAKTALDLDMPDEAVEHFTAAVRTSGVKPIVHRYLGQALLRAGRRTEAIDAFKAAARFDPEDAPSLSQLGALYLEAGTDPEVALSLTRQSVAQDPSNTLFRQRLARALAAAGFPAEAAAEYERLIGGGLSNRELFFEYGRLQKALDRDDLAVEAFERALEIDPEFGPAADALSALKA